MKFLSIIIGLFLAVTASAGLFGSDEPTKEFLSLKVTAVSTSRKDVTFPIQEFVDMLKIDDDNKISWEKSSDTVWILKVKRKDKMTGTTSKLGWEFAKADNKAIIKRMSADELILKTDYEITNGFQTYAYVIEQLRIKNKK